ncbi:MAG: Crp/Fnr family transcriptional regulator [Treponema sp.]|jgi:CRP-like cAMP-binding protein|nr:Crp/Fnr family transcriptional regulator [Treponema sp.]
MAINFDIFSRFSKSFSNDDIIFSEFEKGDTFYLIQTGQVKLVKIAGNIEKIIDVLQPSDMFGEMAILENSPRTATALAVGEVTLLEFNRQNFNILMQGNPQIALELLKTFAKRIYDQKRRLAILTMHDPQAKIASVFLLLAETNPNDAESDRREFFMDIEDLAHWAGLSVSKTRDALSNFINQRIVESTGDKIIVKNINLMTRFIPLHKRP